MKFELRHIIPILILATFMTGCTDSPLPDAAPEAPARPLSFSIPSATLDPTYPLSRATDPDLTEEIVLWQGEQIFTGKGEKLTFDNSCFIKNKPAVGGTITVEVKDLKELEDDIINGNPQKSPRIRFILGSGFDYWFDNKIGNGQTPNWEKNGFSYYQITINETIAEKMQELDLRIQVNCCTLTKITYTAMRTGGLIYDGLHTQFIDGSLLGCVIAYKDPSAEGGYAYKANSCWTWHEEGLILTKLFDADNQPLDISDNTIIRHFNPDETAALEDPADPLAPYYLKLLDETAEYAFFFYYPYVDEEIITQAVTDANGQKDNYPYEIINQYNPPSVANTLNRVVGSMEGPSGNITTAPWTKFPVIPHYDFSTSVGRRRLENSDFMHAIVTTSTKGDAISKTNSTKIGNIPVELKKRMVTMDLLFLEKPTDLSMKPEQNPSLNYQPAMIRTYDFDLSTGKFTGTYNYEPDPNKQTTPIEGVARYSNSEYSLIKPYYVGTVKDFAKVTEEGVTKWVEKDFYCYRLVLAPQKKGELLYNLSFKVAGSNSELKLQNIQLNPLLSELKSGYYYRLRFTKTGDDTGWHLLIDDWKDGGDQTLTRPD